MFYKTATGYFLTRSKKLSDNNQEENEDSFADLFEAYESEMNHDIKVGDKINGKIIAVGDTSIFIDTGSKSDGVVEKLEFTDEDGNVTVKEGDSLELYVVKKTESEMILSKAVSNAGSDVLGIAYESRTPVEGKVLDECKGGFNVEVLKKRAFCPVSQIDTRYVENPEEHVGKDYTFLVTEFKEGGRNIIVSRREYLNIDLDKKIKEFFETAKPSDLFNGTVIKLMKFGAFVELDAGVEGLVHISELGWSRVKETSEAVSVGEKVRVKLLSFEKNSDIRKTKISLSIKQVSEDPWDLVDSKFHVGDNITGKVTKLMDFGAFVEIGDGTEGLVHISEMSYTKRILRPEDAVSVGETIDIVIKDIDLIKKRISLSMKDATGDPWSTIDNKFEAGKIYEAQLEKRENFGLFLKLEPGITGLLPKSKMRSAEDPKIFDRLKPGDSVPVKVLEINKADRKILLSPPSEETNSDWKGFVKKDSSSLGSLGDLLQEAMNKKK
ncbi:MAG: 30S ribosomal protein S1 [Desulfobacterales bacterium]|nr:30S ribosomal protein S1 [Desulfobacterales bacterium]